MAEQYASFVITNAGKNIISRIITGLKVTFSNIKLGDGFDYDTDSYVAKTELINEVLSLAITDIKITDSKAVELTAQFAKSDIESSFWYREIGVYIVDPDDETKEILFAYGNRNDAAEYITPHIQNYAVLKNIKCLVRVGESTNVNILYSVNDKTETINFISSDWVLDETKNIYKLELGYVRESLKIFKTTATGKVETGIVTTERDVDNCTILKALTAFDGCAVCV